jgi:hypothetical protein
MTRWFDLLPHQEDLRTHLKVLRDEPARTLLAQLVTPDNLKGPYPSLYWAKVWAE